MRQQASNHSSWGAFVLRVVVGVVFAAHGAQKLFSFGLDGVASFMGEAGFPLPYVSAVAATAAELLGGVALVAGFYTRLAAIPLAFTMLVAMVKVHLGGGFFLPEGFEYTFTLFGASVALVLLGSGPVSIDAWRGNRKS
jgi:putative oxidoreductase